MLIRGTEARSRQTTREEEQALDLLLCPDARESRESFLRNSSQSRRLFLAEGGWRGQEG